MIVISACAEIIGKQRNPDIHIVFILAGDGDRHPAGGGDTVAVQHKYARREIGYAFLFGSEVEIYDLVALACAVKADPKPLIRKSVGRKSVREYFTFRIRVFRIRLARRRIGQTPEQIAAARGSVRIVFENAVYRGNTRHCFRNFGSIRGSTVGTFGGAAGGRAVIRFRTAEGKRKTQSE